MKSTLLISTYNWPEALELVLLSVLNQSILPDEVVIADDGSTDETSSLIAQFKAKFPIPLIHVWQEDDGFRKSIILNKAIAKANGDYIIQVDGDCILHKNFIKDHLKNRSLNTYLYGTRVNIKEFFLKTLFETKTIHFNFFSNGIKKRTRAIYSVILGSLSKPQEEYSEKFRGCNVSFYKSDFIAVNGYNEDFKGWGREDSELVIRFHNSNLRAKRLRYVGIVYHIFHQEKSRDRFDINDSIEQNTIKNKRTWTNNGVDKYLK